MSERLKKALGVSIFVAITYAVTMFGTWYYQYVQLKPLISDQVAVTGSILETYRQDHCTCKYVFVVNNQKFEKKGRSCCNRQIGEELTIYYSPSQPTISTNYEPSSTLNEWFWGTVFGQFLMPAIAFIFVFFRTSSKSAE